MGLLAFQQISLHLIWPFETQYIATKRERLVVVDLIHGLILIVDMQF